MKKLLFLFILTALSCSKSEDNNTSPIIIPPTLDVAILGKWKLDKKLDITSNCSSCYQNDHITPCGIQIDFFQFNSDNTAKVVRGIATSNPNFCSAEYDNDTYTLSLNPGYEYIMMYKLDDLGAVVGTNQFYVKSFSSSQLVLTKGGLEWHFHKI